MCDVSIKYFKKINIKGTEKMMFLLDFLLEFDIVKRTIVDNFIFNFL